MKYLDRAIAYYHALLEENPGLARTCAEDEKTHKVYVFYYTGTSRENLQLTAAVLAP